MELIGKIVGFLIFLVVLVWACEAWGILTVVGGVFVVLLVLAWLGY